MNSITWAYLENIIVVIYATTLAYAWDSGWPFLLLLCMNSITTRTKRGDK